MEPKDALYEPGEVRLYLLYLLRCGGQPISYDMLLETAVTSEVVSYFQFTDAFCKMTESGQITEMLKDGATLCHCSLAGDKVLRELGSKLPWSVRRKGLDSVMTVMRAAGFEMPVTCEIVRSGSGYTVSCSIADMDGALMRASLFVPTAELAERARANFRAKALTVYKSLLHLLTDTRFFTESDYAQPDEDEPEQLSWEL